MLSLRCLFLMALMTQLAPLALAAGEAINHAGRILDPVPPLTTPLLFNSAAADQVMAGLQIMPRDNPWNEDIAARPVHPSSAAIIARIDADLAANRKGLRAFHEMNYSLIPDTQPRVRVRLLDYPAESDDVIPGTTAGTLDGHYPFHATLPVETWPVGVPGVSLANWQVDTAAGDRHAIAFQPGTGLFWETWQTRRTPAGPTPWQASNGARFDMGTNALRPDGWTSGDAAGLPMLPALVRYDEVQRGEIEHALRLIVRVTRRAYIYPATHFASSATDANLPAMGQRLRLKAGFAVPTTWSHESRVVAAALKRYGGLVADNGGFLSLSVTPDDRWPAGCFDDLRDLTAHDFEVIQTTGPNDGPRSAGAPTVNAGADRQAAVGQALALAATSTGSGLNYTWYIYPYAVAPGPVIFGTPNQATTTVTFTTAGEYILMVKASNGIHTPAYDAVRVQVDTQLRSIRLDLRQGSTGLVLTVLRNNGTESLLTDTNGSVIFSNLGTAAAQLFSFLTAPQTEG